MAKSKKKRVIIVTTCVWLVGFASSIKEMLDNRLNLGPSEKPNWKHHGYKSESDFHEFVSFKHFVSLYS